MKVRSVSAMAAIALVSVFLTACGSKVKGNTYESFPISIAFQSGGKAVFSSGPVGTDCTYDESGSKVTLTCGPQNMELTIDSDGNLNGPSDSIGKLIKKKK
jgi:hypothetical protein